MSIAPASGWRQVALVSGGSAGIGRAVCEQLLAQGCEVVSLDIQAPGWQHPHLHAVQVDLLDREATAQALQQVVQAWPINTVVHNAGLIRAALLPDVRLSDLDDLTQLHLACAIQMVQAALPTMQAQQFGRVVLLSSRAAVGLATRSAYSATKAGLMGMARTWALELGPQGITVNVIAPGPIRSTAMFHDVVPAGSDKEAQLAASLPVRRLGEPADVARVAGFFAQPGSGFITGQVLYVCGGASVGSLNL